MRGGGGARATFESPFFLGAGRSGDAFSHAIRRARDLCRSAHLLTFAPAAGRRRDQHQGLRDAVTVNGILSHERALQRIANQNGGTRASGTPGYAASAAYVKQAPEAGRLQGDRADLRLPVLPGTRAGGAVAGLADPDGLRRRSPTTSPAAATSPARSCRPTSSIPPTADAELDTGCEAGDFAGPRAGPAIALIQRGTCFFEVKAANAQAAGYDAVIIFNEGQPGRDELFIGTLGGPRHHPGRRAELRRRRGALRADPGRPGDGARRHRDRRRRPGRPRT